MLCFPSYFQWLLRQPKSPLHKAAIVREAQRSGVSHYLDATGTLLWHLDRAFLSLFSRLSLSLRFLHSKIFHWDEAAIRSPLHTPNPLCLSNHPSPSFPLSSLKSLHSSQQLSSGKRLAFWGRGSRAALMRRWCRVCVRVCKCVGGAERCVWTGNSPL